MRKITKYGQNFLTNKNVSDKIIDTFCNLSQNSKNPILEIGPGKGILTEKLINSTKSQIFCIEIDHDLYANLKKKFEDKIHLINCDILKFNLDTLKNKRQFNIISNTPYYISSKIIDWLIYNSPSIHNGVFMMQKEFTDKILGKAKPDPRNIMFKHIYCPQFHFYVSRGSFSPQPKIRSSVFSFTNSTTNHNTEDLNSYYSFLKLCFKNRRKKLSKNLLAQYEKSVIIRCLEELKIEPNSRAEEIPRSHFKNLFSLLSGKTPT